MRKIGITVFGCEKDEEEAFYRLSPQYGAEPVIINQPVSSCGTVSAHGNQCVSVDHKSIVSKASLAALRRTGVRYLSSRSIGVDHIDLKAAETLGITVENAVYSPDGVADYTLMLMLMLLRQAKAIVTGAEHFDYRLLPRRGRELGAMTVGVVGCGRIGKAVIDRLQGFSCRILACGRDSAPEGGGISTEEVLAESDIITLHAPLTPDTRYLIGPAQIRAMKPGAMLINTGRGALVHTQSLLAALENGRLGGAALDVLEGEEGIFYNDCSRTPVPHPFLPRLQKLPNVIISPHTAYYTRRALFDTVENTILNCLDFERRIQL